MTTIPFAIKPRITKLQKLKNVEPIDYNQHNLIHSNPFLLCESVHCFWLRKTSANKGSNAGDIEQKVKCYFLLAEARKKQKMFFSHTAGGLGRAGRQVRPLFVVASLWPDLCFPTHPPYKVILRQFILRQFYIKLSCLNCNVFSS